jgi:hypothetical protein
MYIVIELMILTRKRAISYQVQKDNEIEHEAATTGKRLSEGEYVIFIYVI